jgi:hypothetical protein
LCGT